jgi:hypothetical protein
MAPSALLPLETLTLLGSMGVDIFNVVGRKTPCGAKFVAGAKK